VRVPFLDPGVVSVAEALHRRQRATLFITKVALKKLAVRYFPKSLIYRKKQGFAAPVEVWLRQYSLSQLRQRCIDGPAVEYVKERAVEKLIKDFLFRKVDYSLQIYSLIVLNSWYRNTCA
jgi:asparagine synthase (glutamine-hydrolysing)